MTLSIRARLTLWYSSIVVLVLVVGASVGWVAQSELSMQRLDDDLARTMATLDGVMRTEFSEGLSLEASAEEASMEVVAPDRALILTRDDGTLLEAWGLPLSTGSSSRLATTPVNETQQLPSGEARVLRHRTVYQHHAYVATVIAPLAPFRAQNAEMARATALGVLVALLAAGAGGWFIVRQTLKPLTRMATQARGINERNPTERLSAPPVADELGDLATSFNELLDRLASSLNAQRQFMADASHELRTPVSVVNTATQVTLARETRSNEEYRESLTIIAEQATRLSRLVDAMFLLSRAEARGVPLRPEFLHLDELIAESVRALRVLAGQRGVTVDIDGHGHEEIGITADDALLRRMIGNLLDNAVRHADAAGRVTVDLERSDDRVIVRVTNDGPGLDRSQHARIFERFVRLDASDGAGLGLPIARWIAEAHGGSLILEVSHPGRTTFAVSLPLTKPTGNVDA